MHTSSQFLRTVTLAVFSLLAADALAAWEKIGTVPSSARAIVLSKAGNAVGFAADSKGQTLFALDGGVTRTSPLTSAPLFYAYAHDVSGTTICTAHGRTGTVSLLCSDSRLVRTGDYPLSFPMSSGALLLPDLMWVVDGSGTLGSREAPLVALKRTAGDRWEETARHASPLCRAEDAPLVCSEIEIHPMKESALAVIPLLGRFDGEVLRYPTIGIWNPENGSLKHVPVPPVPVPETLRQHYRPLLHAPMRLVYRSAASSEGQIAVIAVLPSDERAGVKRNQLWLYDGAVTWKKVIAPAQLNAVAFLGEVPVVVTTEGIVLRWKP